MNDIEELLSEEYHLFGHREIVDSLGHQFLLKAGKLYFFYLIRLSSMDHRIIKALVGQHLIISGMSAKIHQPRKRALDDPTAWYAGALFGDDFQVYFVRLF